MHRVLSHRVGLTTCLVAGVLWCLRQSSGRRTQQLWLLRHGESEANRVYRHSQTDAMIFDAPLTEKGRQQAAACMPACRMLRPELVIMSPLTRAIETCLGAYPRQHHPDATYEVWWEPTEQLLAASDIGSSKQTLQARFPDLDFSGIPDVWWYTRGEEAAGDPEISRSHFREFGYLETERYADWRVDLLVARLQARPETRIVLVGHADLFNRLLERYFGLDIWLNNCQLYPVELADDGVPNLNLPPEFETKIEHPSVSEAAATPEAPVANTTQRRMVWGETEDLSLIHISEPTRLLSISYAVFCLKKKKKKKREDK
eukprot:TRINITY_DN14336_c0_g1_i1.p1 TRINITY_DN14336_c0_g1~~TRINITY_DN14336_c0_g1_i1.p1  ORF type:complete len:316 (-),score=60.07 TRINITY_DN14336_c0_g1_i1:52-999(-)